MKDYLKYSDCINDRSLLLEYKWVSLWEYKESMKYYISYFNKNEYIVLHKWNTTDLSSTPCYAQCIIPKEKYLISCIHDEGYSTRTTYVYVTDRNNLSLKFQDLQEHWERIDDKTFIPNKTFWDLIFLHGMLEEDLVFYWNRSIKPYLWYLAVKFFWRSRYKFTGHNIDILIKK